MQDVLFGAAKRAKKIEVVTKKSGKPKATSVTLTPSLGLGMALQSKTQKATKIEPLASNRMNPGCLALGIVLSIARNHALVSLPGGHVGKLTINELSDQPLQAGLVNKYNNCFLLLHLTHLFSL
jgi:hypothetical protein